MVPMGAHVLDFRSHRIGRLEDNDCDECVYIYVVAAIVKHGFRPITTKKHFAGVECLGVNAQLPLKPGAKHD